jgi:hypothetical protein
MATREDEGPIQDLLFQARDRIVGIYTCPTKLPRFCVCNIDVIPLHACVSPDLRQQEPFRHVAGTRMSKALASAVQHLRNRGRNGRFEALVPSRMLCEIDERRSDPLAVGLANILFALMEVIPEPGHHLLASRQLFRGCLTVSG